MVSTLTDENGYFRLRLKDKSSLTAITVSKQQYADTSIMLSSLSDQPFRVLIIPSKIPDVTPPVVKPVEKTQLGDFFLSSKQKIQSLNLNFLVESPFQSRINAWPQHTRQAQLTGGKYILIQRAGRVHCRGKWL